MVDSPLADVAKYHTYGGFPPHLPEGKAGEEETILRIILLG
jgi:hypothetical protein